MLVRKIKRRVLLIKNRIRSWTFEKKLRLLNYLSKKDLIVGKHSCHYSRTYPVSGVNVLTKFDAFRVQGRLSYVAQRIVSTDEEWFYRKKDGKRVLVLSNSVIEEAEITMKAELDKFLFHPPMFEPSVWVHAGRLWEFAVCDYSSSSAFRKPEGETVPKIDVKTHTVDLSKCQPRMLSRRFSMYEYNRRSDSIISIMADDLLRHIVLRCEEINEIISGIKEEYTFNSLTLLPDHVCPHCGKVLFAFKNEGVERCTNCHIDVHGGKLVDHLTWLKELENDRDRLRGFIETYGS